jgi:hypothetical protein
VDPPVFSHPGGYFAPPLSLELACPTPGAEIRFTADATDPGEASTLYAAPIRVIRPLCIRARAFAPGRAPSPVRFATFLPGIQPPLPLLCLVTDPRHLHDPNTGLHTQVGGTSGSTPTASTSERSTARDASNTPSSATGASGGTTACASAPAGTTRSRPRAGGP